MKKIKRILMSFNNKDSFTPIKPTEKEQGRFNGFSLMELMIVLLVVSIIAAVTAPMMSKKIARSVATGSGAINPIGTNNNYGNPGDGSLIIGDFDVNDTASKEYIASNEDGQPQIGFGVGSRNPRGILRFSNNNSLTLGRFNFPMNEENNQEHHQGATGNDSIAIGSSTGADGKNSIAIGNLASAVGENSIAIGNGAIAKDKNQVAFPEGYTLLIENIETPKDDDDHFKTLSFKAPISFTNRLETTASCPSTFNGASTFNGSAEFNNGATVSGGHFIVGEKAIATFNGTTTFNVDTEFTSGVTISGGHFSVSGQHSEATFAGSIKTNSIVPNSANKITLGDADTTIYIPGNLIVDGSAVLGYNNGNKNTGSKKIGVYLRESGTGTAGSSGDLIKFDGAPGDQGYPGYSGNQGFRGAHVFFSVNPPNDEATDKVGTDEIKYQSCDRRLKNVGEKFTAGLEELKKLDLYNFTFKADENKTPQVGVMAQDLQKVFPNAVWEGADKYLRIRWDEMFYAIINAVKELDSKISELAAQVKSNADVITKLQAQVEEQKQEIKEQKQEIKDLKAQNKEFEKRLAKLERKQP